MGKLVCLFVHSSIHPSVHSSTHPQVLQFIEVIKIAMDPPPEAYSPSRHTPVSSKAEYKLHSPVGEAGMGQVPPCHERGEVRDL